LLQERHWDVEIEDEWSYIWGSNTYNRKKAYSGSLEASPFSTIYGPPTVVCYATEGLRKPVTICFLNVPSVVIVGWDLTLQSLDMLIEARTAFGSCIFIKI
jgi:hypothetical protein